MSSSEPERLISTISPDLPIPELFKLIKQSSSSERDFDEVQKILMDRENNMKTEMERLNDWIGCSERYQFRLEEDKMDLEFRLESSEKKCEKLNEKLNWLYELGSKMASNKNNIIFQCCERLNELNDKNLEKEQLLDVYRGKCKCLDLNVVKMDKEIKDSSSRHEKMESMAKKLKSEKAAEVKIGNLSPRIMEVEEVLDNFLEVKVEKLANVVDGINNSTENLPMKGDIIEICDGDDKMSPGGAAYISDTLACVGQIETNRGDCYKGSPISSTPKRKRSLCISDDDMI